MAGEHGRGFSIVVKAVRKLAANSQMSLQGTVKVLNEIETATFWKRTVLLWLPSITAMVVKPHCT